MGFQKGTTIDPRLGALDYSGFVNAANIRANAMVDIGQKIGGFIEKYAAKKEEKAQQAEFENAVTPYMKNITGGDETKAKELAKLFASNPEQGKFLMDLISMEQEQGKAQMTQQILDAVGAGEMTPQEASARGVPTDVLQDYINVTKGNTAKQSDEAIAIVEERLGATYDPVNRNFVISKTFSPDEIIPMTDPRVSQFMGQTPGGKQFSNAGFQVMGTTNGDASRSEGSGQSANVVTPPVTSAALNNVAPVNTEGSRAGRFVGGIDDSVSSVINKGVSTAQQVGVNALASVPAGLQYLLSEDDPSFGSNFRISQSILSNLQPDFDLQRFPSREQVRAEALNRFQ